ncbi:MAG TPA: hypothetical protein VFW92_02160, partial [Candidatus Limnocylindrales bacterium]|nr:hypothetical protein [Candidatus Limnocylindrales bacterium]
MGQPVPTVSGHRVLALGVGLAIAIALAAPPPVGARSEAASTSGTGVTGASGATLGAASRTSTASAGTGTALGAASTGEAIVRPLAAPAVVQPAALQQIGYEDGSFTGSSGGSPSGSKPESKLWYAGGAWWASMWSPSADSFEIFRLSADRTSWSDTGVALDDRPATRADTLWDGSHLYVASHIYTESNSSRKTGTSNAARLYRFSFDGTTYHLDSGFPVLINDTSSETLTVAQDSTGQLWATWAQDHAVYVDRTTGSDASWGTPFALTVAGASTLTSDDISDVVAFGGADVGVMWSNQNAAVMYFAVHRDADPDTTWQASEAAARGPDEADDHINLKADSAGRVYAAVKTSLNRSDEPLINLLVRSTAGSWASYLFGTGHDSQTRPIVELDEGAGVIHMFATCPQPPNGSGQSGGDICEKTSPLTSIAFAAGSGTPVIQDPDSDDMNNVSSTKQNVSSASGLAFIATDDTTQRYWHGFETLGGTPPPNTAPSAVASSATTAQDTPVSVTLRGHDAESCELTFTITTAP